MGLGVNHLNPEGISLFREKLELTWAPDSLFYDLDKSNDSNIDDSSTLNISEIEVEKKSEIKKTEEVIKETETASAEEKKSTEENKETIAFSEPKAITLEQAYSLFNKGVKFVDARDESDYQSGNITNSINIPFDDFDNHKQKLDLLPKEKPLVIYCAGTDCDLSILLGNMLFEQGYKQVYIFFGGWLEWLNAEYPITNPTK